MKFRDFNKNQEKISSSFSPSFENITSGLKKGIPIALGYIPIAIAFGLLAKANHISSYISIMMSFLVFAGASQFVAINLLISNTGFSGIILTTFIINLRHFLMSASISQKIKNDIPKLWLSIISFGITDETFSVASLSSPGSVSSGFLLGLNIIAYLAWVMGTMLGYFLGSGLPGNLQSSMGIALYSMFIGLLIPGIKNSKSDFTVVILAISLSSFLYWGPEILSSLSRGWKVIISTCTAAFIGAVIFPEKKGDDS